MWNWEREKGEVYKLTALRVIDQKQHAQIHLSATAVGITVSTNPGQGSRLSKRETCRTQ